MKKEVKAIIAVVLAIWIFVMGIEIGRYIEKKAIRDMNQTTTQQQPTDAPTQITTETPTTTQPQENPEPGNNDAPQADNTVPSVQQDKKDPSTLSKEEIIAKMNEYMAKLKSEQNMKADKTASVYVNVVDCSVPAIIGTINNVINNVTGELSPEEHYVFVNGVSPDAEGAMVTPRDVIPPTQKDFLLTNEGVASATAKLEGENTVYSVTLSVEDTTIQNPIPAFNSNAIGYLDITQFNLPINISKGDMHYPGSTVIITVNADGRIIKVNNNIPMNGEGGAKVLGMEGTASFEGALGEEWIYTY